MLRLLLLRKRGKQVFRCAFLIFRQDFNAFLEVCTEIKCFIDYIRKFLSTVFDVVSANDATAATRLEILQLFDRLNDK